MDLAERRLPRVRRLLRSSINVAKRPSNSGRLGAFVGGDLLVQAVTEPADGSEDRLYGNFPSYSLYPPTAGLQA